MGLALSLALNTEWIYRSPVLANCIEAVDHAIAAPTRTITVLSSPPADRLTKARK